MLVSLKYIIILLSFLFIKLNGSSQSAYEKVMTNMQLLENNLTEKVHLHTDRSVFSPGEDIWFKVYLLEGTSHLLTFTSQNLYVEMISPDGEIVDSIVVYLYKGTGCGDFHLGEEKYTPGEYRLRAYTNFMRNFGKDIYFSKSIIINGQNEKKELKNNSSRKVNLKFFPEGGELVFNTINKLAFKATDNSGCGTDVKISIYDDDDNLVQKAVTMHNGMGFTILIPEKGKGYYAVIDSSAYEQTKFKIPDPISGYSLILGNQFDNTLDFQINASPEIVHGQHVSLIIQSRGMLFATQDVIIDKTSVKVQLEKDQLPGGISCITLYNEYDIPVCERLFFNKHFKKLQIDAYPDKTMYGPKEKVTLTIETKDENNNPVPASVSLAVVDKLIDDLEKNLQLGNTTLLSSILVNSDLKGTVEDLPYYFENFDRKKHFLFDLVLLTHGWRKYIWKEHVSRDTMVMNFGYERGFTFSGKLNRLLFGKPLTKSRVTLSYVEDGIFSQETRTDSTGKFRFDNIYLLDTTKVIFQGYNKNDKLNTIINLDNNNYPRPGTEKLNKRTFFYESTEKLSEFKDQSARIKRLHDSLEVKRHILIEEITVKEKKRENDGHSRIYFEADHVLDVDDLLIQYSDIFSMIAGRFAGVHVSGTCLEGVISIRGPSSLTGSNEPGFLLDGMFVDRQTLCNISPFDVDKIEILKGPRAYIFGSRGRNGIIAVYTKRGVEFSEVSPPGIMKTKQKGYYRTREFYSPDYDKPQEEFIGVDIRNTLYWEPFITTNDKGKAQVSFFNSDKITHYNITVEGVGLEGGLGQTSLNFQVSDN